MKGGVTAMLRTDQATDPEYQSIEAFVEYLIDDEGETEFDYVHLGLLAHALDRSRRDVCKELEEEWGLTLAKRPKPLSCRTFSTSSHDRWYGPGSSPTHGGSGYEQIVGFAGQQG
jgi:hypothetical protein